MNRRGVARGLLARSEGNKRKAFTRHTLSRTGCVTYNPSPAPSPQFVPGCRAAFGRLHFTVCQLLPNAFPPSRNRPFSQQGFSPCELHASNIKAARVLGFIL